MESQEARRKRAELVANLQWLCRLFLETREQLYAAHDGMLTEAAVCDGLREEFDAVRFRRTLEEALSAPGERKPLRAVLKLLRSFGRRVLHGRQRSSFGRRAHEQFIACCAGHSNGRAFVLVAVPRVLQLFDRLIEESRKNSNPSSPTSSVGSPAGGSHGHDPWADSGDEEDGNSSGAGWEMLDSLLEHHRGPGNLGQLHDEADEFLEQVATGTNNSKPAPLQLPADGDRHDGGRSSPLGSGGRAPRGRGLRKPQGAAVCSESVAGAAQQRLPAHAPFYSGDPALLAKVAKAPLTNLDALVGTLVPGAELTTEGLLLQLADEELVMFAYALEQITEAASRKLVKELEARDELRSTCMHRREYLQLLESVR